VDDFAHVGAELDAHVVGDGELARAKPGSRDDQQRIACSDLEREPTRVIGDREVATGGTHGRACDRRAGLVGYLAMNDTGPCRGRASEARGDRERAAERAGPASTASATHGVNMPGKMAREPVTKANFALQFREARRQPGAALLQVRQLL
jgi:hypothetical protein